MQHVVEIAFNFDDTGVKRAIESGAEQKIIEDLKQDLLRKLYQTRRWGNKKIEPEYDPLSDWSESIIRDLFNENREEIMNRAAKLVADSVKKSKYYKEGIADICKELSE